MMGGRPCKPVVRAVLRTGVAVWLGAGSSQAANWADVAGTGASYAESKALCARARNTTMPPPPGPAPKSCNSSALLFGIGRPVDVAAARACAAREMADGDAPPTRGAATLAMLYANGAGVPRDYDVALAFACVLDGARAEMDARVKHLARLKANGPDKTPFDVCDDITSGFMMGFCAQREGALADATREAALDGIVGTLSPRAKAAFTALHAAQAAFVVTSAENEVDLSGTARGAFIVEHKAAHEDAFLATMRAVLAGRLTSADASGADERLNAAYAAIMRLADVSSLGTVTKAGVTQAQRAWLRYRDAFVAFAGVAVAGRSPRGLIADLTQARADELRRMTAP